MTKVVRLHQCGGPEVLQLDEVEIGVPAAGEVRIRVGAFGLNRVEMHYRDGSFGQLNFPARIGYEAAGVIEAVGPDVHGWKVGDRVATLYGLSMEDYGTHAEVILYPANMLVAVPASQSLVSAAASWMQYGTAYALVEVGKIKAGDWVAITAASSSVGLAAIQIARSFGAIPVAITRGQDKAQALKDAGAAHVIISDTENPAERLLELTGGKGVELVFDAVAGAPLAALLPAVKTEGIIMVYGMLAGWDVTLPLGQFMPNNITLRGIGAHLFLQKPDVREQLIRYVSEGLAKGTLKPIIAREFALEQVADAHRYLEGNAQIGKIVVKTATAAE